MGQAKLRTVRLNEDYGTESWRILRAGSNIRWLACRRKLSVLDEKQDKIQQVFVQGE